MSHLPTVVTLVTMLASTLTPAERVFVMLRLIDAEALTVAVRVRKTNRPAVIEAVELTLATSVFANCFTSEAVLDT
jgi:hypothetical protein